MDEADLANDLMELALSNKLKELAPLAPPVNDTGLCLGCGEPIEDTRRWHNAECREYWEQDNRRK
jgi:hypothetical protein